MCYTVINVTIEKCLQNSSKISLSRSLFGTSWGLKTNMLDELFSSNPNEGDGGKHYSFKTNLKKIG